MSRHYFNSSNLAGGARGNIKGLDLAEAALPRAGRSTKQPRASKMPASQDAAIRWRNNLPLIPGNPQYSGPSRSTPEITADFVDESHGPADQGKARPVLMLRRRLYRRIRHKPRRAVRACLLAAR